MGPKKTAKTQHSPAQSLAKKLKAKYRNSPGKQERVRRALYAVEHKKVSIRKSAETYGISYGYLQRRLSGEVEIDSRNGPETVFSTKEEEAMANWLKEMAERGMGLTTGDFLNFIQEVVVEEKRKTPFSNNRPSYDWYKSFMIRNSHIIQVRKETPIESNRAKLTKESVDNWYKRYRDFVFRLGLIDRPTCIYNADESGFALGSKAGKVIGPLKKDSAKVPHVSGGHSKQRLTVMFCGSADGRILPPYFIYPHPPPRGYNPLTGAIENSGITYTAKGWMDSVSFKSFLQHFDKHCGVERPVILLIDSVSSHVNMSAFEFAMSKGIELYRLVPNATHLMQPLDVGVFGPLKKRWHDVLRRHTRQAPGAPPGKEKFPELLKEAFLLFYKPLTVINSFRSSGIYPVDSTVITSHMLKPALTFTDESQPQETVKEVAQTHESSSTKDCTGALEALEHALATPVRAKYQRRIEENYDVEGQSPVFAVYKKLYMKSNRAPCVSTITSTATTSTETTSLSTPCTPNTAVSADTTYSSLQLFAVVACSNLETDVSTTSATITCTSSSLSEGTSISNVLKAKLVFPKPDLTKKVEQRKRRALELPDNLTSPESIRKMALRELVKVRQFAYKEKSAKSKYLKQSKQGTKKKPGPKSKSKEQVRKSKPKKQGQNSKSETETINDMEGDGSENVSCMGCHMTWKEDQFLTTGSLWIQCDSCDGWIHKDCCVDAPDSSLAKDAQFICPECES